MNNKLYLQCLILSSGHFLCETYPNNWEDLTEEAQLEFVQANLWEPMENKTPSDVMSYIENAATCTYQFIQDLN